MANEAVILKRYGNNGDVADYTIADGSAIPIGSLLSLADPETAAVSTTALQPLAGLANTAKEASDTSTRLGAVTNCDAKMYVSGSVTAGQMAVAADTTTYPNYVAALLTATASGAAILGYFKETATNGQTAVVRVKL